MNIMLKTNDKDYFGMSCPQCKAFFQVMKDTGQGDFDSCFCPACGKKSARETFLTNDQIQYTETSTINDSINQIFGSLRSNNHLKVSEKNPPVHQYQEPNLPIESICTACACKFASNTPPTRCPNCGNSLTNL